MASRKHWMGRPLIVGLLALGLAGGALGQEQEELDFGGSGGCPCLQMSELPTEWMAIWQPNSTCRLVDGGAYTGRPNEPDYCYPVSYGSIGCEPYDERLQPFCADALGEPLIEAPGWCSNAWCYVDTANCDLDDPTPTAFLLEEGSFAGVPHYSYETCGIENYYARFRRAFLLNASSIVGVVETYVADLRDFMEAQTARIQEAAQDAEGTSSCPFIDGCACTGCERGTGSWLVPRPEPGGWLGYEVDHGDLVVVHRGDTDSSSLEERESQCLAALSRREFMRIARLEYNDPSRLGWLFFGDQRSAVWFGWPGITFCPSETSIYDPRFRPWYVSAVSGPKDMVIILDKSGSMQAQDRWGLASLAAQEVLKTLTEFDYVSIVTFSSESDSFEGQAVMQPATNENVERMTQWLDTSVPMGSTNFRAAFGRAFGIIDASLTARHSTGCNGLVLFLTDGLDRSGFEVSEISTMNSMDFTIFTYSFGNEADRQLPKDIACTSRGIWHHIPDGGNIGEAMSNYFTYYAEAFSEEKQIRWAMYEEISTANDLISGCLPVYDRTVTPHQLLGVVGMDVSIVISIPELRGKDDWNDARNEMREINSRCFRVGHSEETLERLRSHVAHDSQCSVELSTPVVGTASGHRRGKVALMLWTLPCLLGLLAPL